MKRRTQRSNQTTALETGAGASSSLKTQPLDELDQERLVQQFQRDLTHQHEQIQNLFQWLVYSLVVACPLLTLYYEFTTTTTTTGTDWTTALPRILHGLISAPLLHYATLLHVTTTRTRTPMDPNETTTISVSLGSIVSHGGWMLLGSWMILQGVWVGWQLVHPPDDDTTNNHLLDEEGSASSLGTLSVGLAVSNLCTLAFALVIELDQQSLQTSLRQLDESRYHFKSL